LYLGNGELGSHVVSAQDRRSPCFSEQKSMAVEAFVWFYQDGEPVEIEVAEVLNAFGGAVAMWEPETGRMQLDFGDPSDTCEIYVDREAASSGFVSGLLISRPVQAPRLWSGVLELMSAHHGLLFFSDDTTPRFRDLADAAHYPPDLLQELGALVEVSSVADITGGRTGLVDL
jgi:hypothetical protein